MKTSSSSFGSFVLLTVGLLIGIASCRPADYAGHYKLKHYPKTSIDLRKDGTFQFTNLDADLYHTPLEHQAGNYFIAQGTWLATGDSLILNGNKRSTSTRNPEVIEMTKDLTKLDSGKNVFGRTEPLSFTTFIFCDIFGDTVDILFGQFSDGSVILRLHRPMRYLQLPTTRREGDYNFNMSDTIEFHFSGYKPYQFIRPDRERRNIKIRLYPEERNDVFDSTRFIVTRKRIKGLGLRFNKMAPRTLVARVTGLFDCAVATSLCLFQTGSNCFQILA